MCIFQTSQFYVPGMAPVEFRKGQQIDVKAVKMTSVHTQLPYEYYSLPFCLPKNGSFHYKSENLGEVLRGDRIVNTPYIVKMAEDVQCSLLCHFPNKPMHWSAEDSQRVIDRIQHEYFVHLLVDNLPAASPIFNQDLQDIQYEHGYRLGNVIGDKNYINNHLKLTLLYHNPAPEVFRVVGFHVQAKSVHIGDLTFTDNTCTFPTKSRGQLVDAKAGTTLYFTYEVEWRHSKISWASRWDTYLAMNDVQIHWFSIINSLVVIFFLSGILTMIMVRTLRRDIARYNADDGIDEAIEETGWKLVHGDIFRPPKNSRLFAAVIGSVFAMLGMLSPASRGALMTVAIFLYVFMGLIAGYFSARLYKTMKGREWKKSAFLTATFYPGIIASTCFFLNFFIWGKASSGAVPFSTMLSLLSLWFCISLPLVYLGYYFGYRKQPFQHPVRTNQIPRQVPDQHWYMNPILW
ncbi:transmembrane 9 superfamily protein [Holotrichia oblita]|uniref:Transmembrane 9 superfamily protein n=2 Tax=Holotrichia oblita TaxID=644536 RepID=A0ACB9TE30_HOLOL|nr:transmembrane 9 superfamily protein [Holotrichia oblita]KAI4465017.1 transmembrane 9 superfamily protein [Holotrichia oblita]